MSCQSYTFLCICLVELLLLVTIAQSSIDDSCDTMPTEIHITKEEYDDLGRLVRSCTGEVGLNKCEGMCTSQVQPSVVTPTGFLKVYTPTEKPLEQKVVDWGKLVQCIFCVICFCTAKVICSRCLPLAVAYVNDECACCKETFMRDRLVILSHCYDPDGIRLEEESRAMMEVRLREPAECKCSKCGDYGR